MSNCCPSDKDKGSTPPPIQPGCPTCQNAGTPVNRITPQHTLKGPFRSTLSSEDNYHFCENPECDTVYFSADGEQSFSSKQLINRVTCKDSSPETPLCYCYKITKGDALKEYQESGESTVSQQIEQKMTEKSCFCDKSNPRGICCTDEIKDWLKERGMKQRESNSKESSCSSSCC